VERGGLEKVLLSTAGIGVADIVITDSGLKAGDKIIVTGTIGNHQLALLSQREGLRFDSPIESDIAPLWDLVSRALKVGDISSMKDPTRGGLSGALNDMAKKSNVDILLMEEEIPVKGVVRSATEMLGLDPMELANEGVAVMGVEHDRAEEVLKAIRANSYGKDASIVGEAIEGQGRVIMETFIGGRRIVREPFGSPMTRIC
jgi:hydrogenase expression/formation protein HypE